MASQAEKHEAQTKIDEQTQLLRPYPPALHCETIRRAEVGSSSSQRQQPIGMQARLQQRTHPLQWP